MKVKNKLVTTLSLGLLAFSMQTFADGSLSVEKDMVVNAEAATVWRTVGDFNQLNDWHPAVTKSEIIKGENNVAGAERLLTLANEATITERLVSYSADEQSYTYIILDSPFPVKNYNSTIQVSPAGEGKAKVTWKSTFDADGAADEKAIEVITGVYDGGLNNLKTMFAK